jgi:hypothetical protein
LPENEQRSKHGGGGRYNAILEFKGEQIKNILMRKKKIKNEYKEKREYIYVRKRKIYESVYK